MGGRGVMPLYPREQRRVTLNVRKTTGGVTNSEQSALLPDQSVQRSDQSAQLSISIRPAANLVNTHQLTRSSGHLRVLGQLAGRWPAFTECLGGDEVWRTESWR